MAGYQSSNVLSIFRDLTGQFDISHQTNISKLLGLRQKEPKYSSIYEYLKRDTREMREECVRQIITSTILLIFIPLSQVGRWADAD